MTRYFIELAYKGKKYHGWQIQPNALTVQQVLNECMSTILRQEINVVGCGRTDTGVHASYFVAHFESGDSEMDEHYFCKKINAILPRDIAVYSLTKVDALTHSRFSATGRTYQYHVLTQKNPFLHDFAYQSHVPLHFDAMNEAASMLLHCTDFTSFSKLHTDVKTNNCKVTYAQWECVDDKWIFTIKADRFLRNMVRAIVGTLLMIGRGKISVEQFAQIIEAKDRGLAGTSAPAHALYLIDVEYPEELFVKADYRSNTHR